MTYVHVIFGALGLLSGFAAMLFAKGSGLHRFAGQAYVVTMLIMTTTAFYISIFLRPQLLNVVASSLTFYIVATAWMTMHRQPENPRGLELAALVMAALVSLGGFTSGFIFLGRSNVPAAVFCFLFAVIALLAALGDWRLVRRRTITRRQKLVRHLWRMSFSLWVATASLFLGQARVLPAWLVDSRLNLVPVFIVIGLMIFWPIRVRFPPWSRKSRAMPSSPAPAKP